MVTIRIPTPLRSLTGGEEQVEAPGETVRAVIDALEQKHPGVRDRLLDAKGVRRFVNIYVGDEDIRFLDGLDTKLTSGQELSIVPAIAGGACRAVRPSSGPPEGRPPQTMKGGRRKP